jgi:DNA-binding PadR family transcriptional regulator
VNEELFPPVTTEQYLPLSEATFFILLSLAGGPKHGYAIMKDVAELSDGRVGLSTGTLYGALKRLLEQGLIQRIPSKKSAGVAEESIRSRKSYALSRFGRRTLESEVQRIEDLAEAARLRTSGANA